MTNDNAFVDQQLRDIELDQRLPVLTRAAYRAATAFEVAESEWKKSEQHGGKASDEYVGARADLAEKCRAFAECHDEWISLCRELDAMNLGEDPYGCEGGESEE